MLGSIYLQKRNFFDNSNYKSLQNVSLENSILPDALKNKNIYGLKTKVDFIDIGIPEDYEKIQKYKF